MAGPRGPEYAVVSHPDLVNLCGVCGHRLFLLPGLGDRHYCYKCGRGDEAEPVSYVRAEVAVERGMRDSPTGPKA